MEQEMKAHLTAEGCLVVTAETEVESFALKRWSQDYGESASAERIVSLLIDPNLSGGKVEVTGQQAWILAGGKAGDHGGIR
jgi:uncharacterized protein YllA (UPF0747 family)